MSTTATTTAEPTETETATVTERINPYAADKNNPYRTERWSLSPNMRKAVLKVTLEQCGLDTDGKKLDANPRNLTKRDRLAGMRILASLDQISLDLQKIQYLAVAEPTDAELCDDEFYKTLLTPEIIERAAEFVEDFPSPPEPDRLTPEGAGKRDRDRTEKLLEERWPISNEVRLAVSASALEIIGFAVIDADNDIVEALANDDDPSTNREIRSALRILVRFERLSVMKIGIEAKIKALRAKHPLPEQLIYSPEAVAKINELMHQEFNAIYALKNQPEHVPENGQAQE
jgi:hypothetical protein